MKKCICRSKKELWDDEALCYIKEHLRQIEVRKDGWEAEYVCPNTGIKWIEDYPEGELHGGGPLRLRKLKNK